MKKEKLTQRLYDSAHKCNRISLCECIYLLVFVVLLVRYSFFHPALRISYDCSLKIVHEKYSTWSVRFLSKNKYIFFVSSLFCLFPLNRIARVLQDFNFIFFYFSILFYFLSFRTCFWFRFVWIFRRIKEIIGEKNLQKKSASCFSQICYWNRLCYRQCSSAKNYVL